MSNQRSNKAMMLATLLILLALVMLGWLVFSHSPLPSGRSTVDKIMAAEQAGQIDHDTALLYYLYSDYDPVSVPPEYRGDNSSVVLEGTTILAELSARLDKMTASTREVVQPLFRRPDDATSFWAQHLPPLLPTLAHPGLNAPLPIGVWQSIPLKSPNINIWYRADTWDIALVLANYREISQEWWLEQQVMLDHQPCRDDLTLRKTFGGVNPPPTGGDGGLDVYVVPREAGNLPLPEETPINIVPVITSSLYASFLYRVDGLTVPIGEASECAAAPLVANLTSPRPAFIIIFVNPNQPDGSPAYTDVQTHLQRIDNRYPQISEIISITLAHELFHAFQYSFNLSDQIMGFDTQAISDGNDANGYAWWMEATSTWAEDLVRPDLNYEQLYLSGTWSGVGGEEGPLYHFAMGGNSAYGAYIWPFYLASGMAIDPSTDQPFNRQIIGTLWLQSEQTAPAAVMTKLTGWPKLFAQFASLNWNQPPLPQYQDAGQPISQLAQTPLVVYTAPSGPLPSQTQDALAPPLATQDATSFDQSYRLPEQSVGYYEIDLQDSSNSEPIPVERVVTITIALSNTNSVITDTPTSGVNIEVLLSNNDPDKGTTLSMWDGDSVHVLCQRQCGGNGLSNTYKVVLVVTNSNKAIQGIAHHTRILNLKVDEAQLPSLAP